MVSNDLFLFTRDDKDSAVRGVGRYIQLLRQAFPSMTMYQARSSLVSTAINPFFNLIDSNQLTKRIAKKQIAVIHDLIPLKYPQHFPIGLRGQFNVFKNKQALRHYDLIVTDSEASKKDIMQILRVQDQRVKVIYPALTPNLNQETSTTPSSLPFQLPPKYCLYVGDATWNKNLVFMARAIKKANVTCIVVGKVFVNNHSLNHPWQKELRDFYTETKGDKRFLFPGFISDTELIKIYTQSQFNILLSRDEGFGFSFLESASFGSPSLLSDIPVFREIAGHSAVFSPISDYNEAANKIEELYFDENRRQVLSSKALEQSRLFSFEKFSTEWRSLLFS